MTAFICIYTKFGKENVRTLDSFSIITEQYNLDVEAIHVLMLHDTDPDLIEDMINIVKEGQPCNIHIRYEDIDTEAECTFDCCTVCERTNRILCPDPQIKLIRVKQNDD